MHISIFKILMENNNEGLAQILPFGEFAQKVYGGLSLSAFHVTYYRVLQAFAERKVRRLIVAVPPQHGKSLGSSVLLPAYMLGIDPDLRIAIASYSASLANKFNKRMQRLIDSPVYASLFPDTTIKGARQQSEWVRTSDRVEVVGQKGEVMSVGREGSLTGNQVDIFILDDLYKDAMEANSPVIRENCWEWYTSVVRTRMHNDSSELIVFTRWHEEDLIGSIAAKEKVVKLERWSQLDEQEDPSRWLLLNFEAIKETSVTEVDPREKGEALWEERHGKYLLEEKRKLDPIRFESMYQGQPSSARGLLYGNNMRTYGFLPKDIVRYGNYTDTADTGEDYLCSVVYAVGADGEIYVLDVVYSPEPMEVTEGLVCNMLRNYPTCDTLIESNNGGRGFARTVSKALPRLSVQWFHQGANKEARIQSNASAVVKNILMPEDWQIRWPEFARHITSYKRSFRSNRWHDAPDVLTGIVERELTDVLSKKIKALSFSR